MFHLQLALLHVLSRRHACHASPTRFIRSQSPFPVKQLWKSVKRGLRSSSVPSTDGFNSSYYSSEEESMFDLLLFKSVQLPVGISLCFSYPCRSTTSSRHYVTTRFDSCTSRLSDQNIKDPNLAELQLAVNQPKFIKCYANNWWLMLVVCYPKKPASQTTNAWKKKLKAQNPQHTKQFLNHLKPPLLQLKPNRFFFAGSAHRSLQRVHLGLSTHATNWC